MSTDVRVLGIAGAGTMGAGIAQVSCLGGFETYLHDPLPDALERALQRVHEDLARGAERGRWRTKDARAAEQRLHPAPDLDALSGCELVIEAAPERLELKRELFARLSEACRPGTVLATNTSSLPVTALASAASDPSRVVGMHFFNPVPVMQLLEIVAGVESAPDAVDTARAVGEKMGKTVILASDGPGFLANRCARPFGMEALRLLSQGIADHATIDRVVRMGGGFRMGPFELADLVGIDVGFEVSKSFWEQSFHEPRWRPSTVQARMVQAGRFGRKAGQGYYTYGEAAGGTSHREDDPEPPPAGGTGRVVVIGDGRLAYELRELAADAGFELMEDLNHGGPDLVVDASIGRLDTEPAVEDPAIPLCILCVDGSLATLDAGGTAAGFHALPPLEQSSLVEMTRSSQTSNLAAERAESFFCSLGKHVEWVGDAPGLVLGRIVCQLVNEACFALMERVGSPDDVDTAMRLGYNWQRGPLEWADVIELDQVLTTLDALHEELREERYRTAPVLRSMVAEGRLGRSVGEGFFRY